MLPVTIYHPSTSTKKISLNGREIITGGTIIIPIAIRMEATSRSMIKNGDEQQETDFKSAFQFADHEGRDQDLVRRLGAFFQLDFRRHIEKQFQILVAYVLEHEYAERLCGALQCLFFGDFLIDQREYAVIIRFFKGRRHDEQGKEQSERHDDLVRRRGLRADRGT